MMLLFVLYYRSKFTVRTYHSLHDTYSFCITNTSCLWDNILNCYEQYNSSLWHEDNWNDHLLLLLKTSCGTPELIDLLVTIHRHWYDDYSRGRCPMKHHCTGTHKAWQYLSSSTYYHRHWPRRKVWDDTILLVILMTLASEPSWWLYHHALSLTWRQRGYIK